MKKPERQAEEMINDFNSEYSSMRDLIGYGQELAQCTRLVQTLINTDSLTKESLLLLFKRAHTNIPVLGATYLLSFRAIEHACNTNKFNADILAIIEESVTSDKDPNYLTEEAQNNRNASIMQSLLANERLFELMLPYLK